MTWTNENLDRHETEYQISFKNLFKNPKQYLDDCIWKYLHDVSAGEFFSDVSGSC